eukprot:5878968-Amphidinium_carterae.1
MPLGSFLFPSHGFSSAEVQASLWSIGHTKVEYGRQYSWLANGRRQASAPATSAAASQWIPCGQPAITIAPHAAVYGAGQTCLQCQQKSLHIKFISRNIM